VNLHVPPELEDKLTRLAAKTGRTIDPGALDLLASFLTMMNGSGAGWRTAGSLPMTKSLLARTAGIAVGDARLMDGRRF
jgi:hypothetical protein